MQGRKEIGKCLEEGQAKLSVGRSGEQVHPLQDLFSLLTFQEKFNLRPPSTTGRRGR
jgi:hypothetical protein